MTTVAHKYPNRVKSLNFPGVLYTSKESVDSLYTYFFPAMNNWYLTNFDGTLKKRPLNYVGWDGG